MHKGHKTISYFLVQNCRDDMDVNVFRILYGCDIIFNVPYSPYWHDMVNNHKGYRSPGYDKARTMGLEKEKGKIHNAWK